MSSEQMDVVEILPRDCGYGWSAHLLMSDGTRVLGTIHLHPTPEKAIAEARTRAAALAQYATLAGESHD